MKRRSLVGPILLLLLGTLLLAINLRPEWVSLEMISKYWPFLLIGWGVLRLVEILFWRVTGRPLPAFGISGGEWGLVVLICLVGSGFSFAYSAYRHGPRLPSVLVRGHGVEIFGEAFDFPISEQKPAVQVRRIVIENLRGNTRIVGAETQEVKAEGRKTIRAYQQSEADEAHKKTPIEMVTQGDELVVRTNQEQVSGDRRISTDLELTVPRGVSIQASGRYGDFDILNIDGKIEVNSRNAGVRVQNIGGDVRVDLRRSDIVRAVNVKGKVEILGRGQDLELERIEGEVVINGYYSGELQCRNVAKPILFQSGQTELSVAGLPGKLQMDLGNFSAANVKGPIRLTAKSRDVRLEDFTNSLKLSINRGDIELDPRKAPTGDIEAATESGYIMLKLPVSAKFQLEASTRSGELTNDFGPSLELKTEGRGGILSGTVGKGPRIDVRTRRGSVTISKD